MSWGDLKKGDVALVADGSHRVRKEEVKSVGRKWITTVSGCRFDVATGQGSWWGSAIHTRVTFARMQEKERLVRTLYNANWGALSLETLRGVVAHFKGRQDEEVVGV